MWVRHFGQWEMRRRNVPSFQPHLWIAQEGQRQWGWQGKLCLAPPRAGSLLSAVRFYGLVGGQNSVKNSEGKHFDLDFEPLTVPSNGSCLLHVPWISVIVQVKSPAWARNTLFCFAISSMLSWCLFCFSSKMGLEQPMLLMYILAVFGYPPVFFLVCSWCVTCMYTFLFWGNSIIWIIVGSWAPSW